MLLSALLLSLDAQAAVQCFYDSGTYGNLTVTAAGAGCGNTLTYGGITGVWMGDGHTTESCTFTLSAAADVGTLSVQMTAHSNGSSVTYGETAYFDLDGSRYTVASSDIDNTTPSGGVDLTALSDGGVSCVADDGRGTITFGGTSGAFTALTIEHAVVMGSPAGTIYRVCVDDGPVEVDTDGDGLLDDDEIDIYRTDPKVADTDKDGISDGDEVNLTGTDPLDDDTDDDELKDGSELNTYSTDPFDPDTDDGGVMDGVEVSAGTDPLDGSDDFPDEPEDTGDPAEDTGDPVDTGEPVDTDELDDTGAPAADGKDGATGCAGAVGGGLGLLGLTSLWTRRRRYQSP